MRPRTPASWSPAAHDQPLPGLPPPDGPSAAQGAAGHQHMRATTTPGCRSAKERISVVSGSTAWDGIDATSSRPSRNSCTDATLARVTSAPHGRTGGADQCRPASVSTARRPILWNSSVPRSRSSARTVCDRDGCETSRRRSESLRPCEMSGSWVSAPGWSARARATGAAGRVTVPTPGRGVGDVVPHGGRALVVANQSLVQAQAGGCRPPSPDVDDAGRTYSSCPSIASTSPRPRVPLLPVPGWSAAQAADLPPRLLKISLEKSGTGTDGFFRCIFLPRGT